jgi:hypothetical protein
MGNYEYAITLDYDSGFWQMLIESRSRDKTGFFTPDGKKHYNHLPMGIKNAAPAYVCMTDQLNQIWEGEFFQTDLEVRLVQEIIEMYRTHSPTAFPTDMLSQDPRQLLESDNPGSTVIIDDVIAYARSILVLLAYFKAMLMTLEHHRVAVKLRKCRFLPSRAEFVGMDLLPHGNSPASSKYKAIEHLTRPLTFGDLQQLRTIKDRPTSKCSQEHCLSSWNLCGISLLRKPGATMME